MHPARVFVDGDSQRGQFGEFVVDGDDQFAAAVFPAEQDGRGRAAPGGGGQGDGVIHAFYPDFILGDGEVGPGRQSQGVELGDAAFFNQGVAIGGRGRD